ncbi:hypothetical protein FSCG_00420 [Fusobacterium vincentii 4_1_13]|jgi:hypothetical protein|uniref:CHAT domain-containing protein n=2 Tax=Fusobacterium vincentii TaxID=155615 RepID=A0ABV3YD12_FUSVC|nr:hypothetical protein [Fusobacterium vincentii]EEO39707.1 hypothetical protein FSCG_00420 [Fusobacterium vincentii 4_1_13]
MEEIDVLDNLQKTQKYMNFNYYLLFKTNELDENYQPIIQLTPYIFSKTTHLWDSNLTPIIPALWYIFHLPRNGFDVITNDIELILHTHDEPHNIIIFPYCTNNKEKQNIFNHLIENPILIICPDELYEDIKEDITIPKSFLGIYKVSELTSELLIEQWEKLSDMIISNFPNEKKCIINPNFRLTKSNERKILPLLSLANQFGYTEQLIDEIKNLNLNNNHNNYMINLRKKLLYICNEIKKNDSNFEKSTERILIENTIFNGIPLVITFSGTSNSQIKKFSREKSLPEIEKEIIDILGYHRSIAKKALYISIESMSQELFSSLNQIEEHCKNNAGKIKNIFIWNTLKKIGKIINSKLLKFNINILDYISQITIFSDFPIGLAILPEYSAPLCCIKPISYRPLTPLTRTLQREMLKENQYYLGKGKKIKILILECIEKEDKIREYCDNFFKELNNLIKYKNNEDIELFLYEVPSIKNFKEILKNNKDIDILIISAHGNYQSESNVAGIIIGNEIFMADDNDISVPPVVLLNACHVMPRGKGVVTVGDLFLRAGAKAVLGTFIPVDVRRNSILILRLFANILEVRNGWSPMTTLDQIWQHTVCTNAIHEIISSSSRIEEWANSRKSNCLSPLEDFKLKYSKNNLRKTHIYEDSEKIMKKLAYKDNKDIGEYFENYIKSNSYFPESVFYQFIGFPENIFIRNSDFENMYSNLNNI